jgi:hypothetical protein
MKKYFRIALSIIKNQGFLVLIKITKMKIHRFISELKKSKTNTTKLKSLFVYISSLMTTGEITDIIIIFSNNRDNKLYEEKTINYFLKKQNSAILLVSDTNDLFIREYTKSKIFLIPKSDFLNNLGECQIFIGNKMVFFSSNINSSIKQLYNLRKIGFKLIFYTSNTTTADLQITERFILQADYVINDSITYELFSDLRSDLQVVEDWEEDLWTSMLENITSSKDLIYSGLYDNEN